MTTTQLVNERKKLFKEIQDFRNGQDKKWTPLIKAWHKKNISYKRGKVYELVKNGIKRHGLTRYVIYTFEPSFIDDHVTYRCGGWWLDENNNPVKWDTMTIYGWVDNAIFKLSENQINNPVPKEVAKANRLCMIRK